ncbi:aldo/keto reductase [Lapidilactobacillus salsurivasis]
MEYQTLNNGLQIPKLGLGVFQIWNPQECQEIVEQALACGYRAIDTAAVYYNEAAVGQALRTSGVPRKEITLTSKLWLTDASYEGAKQAFSRSTERLGTDYLDVFLIHQPYGDYFGAWRAMEELYQTGQVKAIGVSNFSAGRLTDLILAAKIPPAINQIELHPYRQANLQRQAGELADVVTEAWSPFHQGRDGIFQDLVLHKIAAAHQKTVAQVILRWQTQQGLITIPKSVHLERMQENLAIFDFRLTSAEMATIAELDQAPESNGPEESAELVQRLHQINPDLPRID